MKIIAFTGSQGSGKTTLKEILTSNLRKLDLNIISNYYNVESSVSRTARELGFTINEETTFETQYYLACRYIVLDLETRKIGKRHDADYIVLDRSVLDVIPYTFVSDNIETGGAKLIEDMLQKHFKLYPVDYLGFTHPLDTIEKVKDERSNDIKFQRNIHSQFEVMFKEERHYTNTEIINIPNDTLENRLSVVMKAINHEKA